MAGLNKLLEHLRKKDEGYLPLEGEQLVPFQDGISVGDLAEGQTPDTTQPLGPEAVIPENNPLLTDRQTGRVGDIQHCCDPTERRCEGLTVDQLEAQWWREYDVTPLRSSSSDPSGVGGTELVRLLQQALGVPPFVGPEGERRPNPVFEQLNEAVRIARERVKGSISNLTRSFPCELRSVQEHGGALVDYFSVALDVILSGRVNIPLSLPDPAIQEPGPEDVRSGGDIIAELWAKLELGGRRVIRQALSDPVIVVANRIAQAAIPEAQAQFDEATPRIHALLRDPSTGCAFGEASWETEVRNNRTWISHRIGLEGGLVRHLIINLRNGTWDTTQALARDLNAAVEDIVKDALNGIASSLCGFRTPVTPMIQFVFLPVIHFSHQLKRYQDDIVLPRLDLNLSVAPIGIEQDFSEVFQPFPSRLRSAAANHASPWGEDLIALADDIGANMRLVNLIVLDRWASRVNDLAQAPPPNADTTEVVQILEDLSSSILSVADALTPCELDVVELFEDAHWQRSIPAVWQRLEIVFGVPFLDDRFEVIRQYVLNQVRPAMRERMRAISALVGCDEDKIMAFNEPIESHIEGTVPVVATSNVVFRSRRLDYVEMTQEMALAAAQRGELALPLGFEADPENFTPGEGFVPPNTSSIGVGDLEAAFGNTTYLVNTLLATAQPQIESFIKTTLEVLINDAACGLVSRGVDPETGEFSDGSTASIVARKTLDFITKALLAWLVARVAMVIRTLLSAIQTSLTALAASTGLADGGVLQRLSGLFNLIRRAVDGIKNPTPAIEAGLRQISAAVTEARSYIATLPQNGERATKVAALLSILTARIVAAVQGLAFPSAQELAVDMTNRYLDALRIELPSLIRSEVQAGNITNTEEMIRLVEQEIVTSRQKVQQMLIEQACSTDDSEQILNEARNL